MKVKQSGLLARFFFHNAAMTHGIFSPKDCIGVNICDDEVDEFVEDNILFERDSSDIMFYPYITHIVGFMVFTQRYLLAKINKT